MAKRRMSSADVIGTDKFYNLSAEGRALYFHLMHAADDDGFIGCANSVVRMVNLPAQALEELLREGYLHRFESGVLAVLHWNVHNKIRQDRHTPTVYRKEASLLTLGEDGVYRLREQKSAAEEAAPQRRTEPAIGPAEAPLRHPEAAYKTESPALPQTDGARKTEHPPAEQPPAPQLKLVPCGGANARRQPEAPTETNEGTPRNNGAPEQISLFAPREQPRPPYGTAASPKNEAAPALPLPGDGDDPAHWLARKNELRRMLEQNLCGGG